MLVDAHAKWMTDFSEYWTDAVQRSVLFTNILRKRGNLYLEHLNNGQPPVLVFDYEMIMEHGGRRFLEDWKKQTERPGD